MLCVKVSCWFWRKWRFYESQLNILNGSPSFECFGSFFKCNEKKIYLLFGLNKTGPPRPTRHWARPTWIFWAGSHIYNYLFTFDNFFHFGLATCWHFVAVLQRGRLHLMSLCMKMASILFDSNFKTEKQTHFRWIYETHHMYIGKYQSRIQIFDFLWNRLFKNVDMKQKLIFGCIW